MQKCRDHQLTDLYIDAVTTLLLNMMNTRLILSLGRKTVESKTQILWGVPQTMVDYANTFMMVDKTPKELQVKMLLCSGIACLGMNEVDRALSDFVCAQGYYCDGSGSTCQHGDPKDEDPLLAEYVAVYRLLEDTPKHQWASLSQKCYKRMMQFVSRVPISHKKMVPGATTISAAIESESHVLRALGYGGDLFESRILQAKGFSIDDGKVAARPFDKIKADKAIEKYKRELVREGKKAKPHDVWMQYPFEDGQVICDSIAHPNQCQDHDHHRN